MKTLSIRKNIALKISIFLSIFVFTLQLVTGILWSETGDWLLDATRTDTIDLVQSTVTRQEASNLERLKNSIDFNIKMLKTILGPIIYNVMDTKPTLLSFMDVEAIQAITVFDEYGEPVGAVWKVGTIESANALPPDFDTKSLLVSKSDISDADSQKALGRMAVYYTDRILLEEIEESKNEAYKQLETTKEKLEKRQSSIRLWQLIGISVILLLFISALFWFISRILNPLKQLADTILEAGETGKLGTRANISSEDEIGQTAIAYNDMMQSQQTAFDEITEVIQGLCHGNLTLRVKGDQKGDTKELGQKINQSLEMLGRTMSQIVLTSEQLAINSDEMASSSQGLATGSSEQAASLEEISSTMQEMAAQTNANNDNANQAQELTRQTLDIVKGGNMQMQSMLEAMDEIRSTSDDVNKIIKVIDDIAFQTNLLALNAAVEAARAGKYGKGFAVVADEVRSLAARSAEAAKNTTELIQSSSKVVGHGASNVEKTATILSDIDESVKKVNEMTGEIVASSKSQKNGIDEINRGLTQINQVVQQNSAISQETASASTELSSQASNMQELMKQFSLRSEDRQLLQTPKTLETKPHFISRDKKFGNVVVPPKQSLPGPKVEKADTAPNESLPAPKEEAVPIKPEVQENRSVPIQKKLILDDSEFGKY